MVLKGDVNTYILIGRQKQDWYICGQRNDQFYAIDNLDFLANFIH